jgi:hypothetical protein
VRVGCRVLLPPGARCSHPWTQQRRRLDIAEAAVTPSTRTCYYQQWQDVMAVQVVSFLTHEAVHPLFDVRRHVESQEVSHAR